MKTITGECRYCGQVQTIMVDHDLEDEESQASQNCEEVSLVCTCDGAQEYQRQVRRIRAAEATIENMFGTGHETDLLYYILHLIVKDKLQSASIKINGRTTASIKKTADGNLSVKRKDVDVEEETV